MRRERTPAITLTMRALEHTAYHEAGHAVAALALDRRFKHVTIVPGSESHGHCRYWSPLPKFRPDLQVSMAGRSLLERMAMTALAGGTAVALFARRGAWRGAEFDVRAAIDYVSYLSSGEEELQAYIGWLRIRVKATLTSDVRKSQLRAVAAALLQSRTLRYDQVDAIARAAVQHAMEAVS